MKGSKKILLFAFFLLAGLVSQAQTRKELEDKKKKLQAEIDDTKRILSETSRKKKQSLGSLASLRKLIQEREKLISAIQEEIDDVEQDIHLQTELLEDLHAEVDKEKGRYARAVFMAFKTRNAYSKLAFVFASSSFNQAIKRLRYFKRFGDYQRNLVAGIQAKTEKVKEAIARLEDTRQSKNRLLGNKEEEKQVLEGDRKEQQAVVKSLAGKEAELKKKLKKQKESAQKLQAAIKSLIAKEIAAAKKKAASKTTAPKTTGTATGSTGKNVGKSAPAVDVTLDALSVEFSKNKGKLPWPSEKGFISEGFGTHAHPDIPGIMVVNNGIEVTTPEGTKARAVFEGTVSAVLSIPGMEKTVLVNHGTYYTVYSRLVTVSVVKGQKLSFKENIGTIATDENGHTLLHFELWHNESKQDPELWLLSK